MKRRIRFFAILGVLATVLFVLGALLWLLVDNKRHIEVPESGMGDWRSRWNSSLKIAVIGDSWASGNKIDRHLKEELAIRGVECEIVSFGHPGGKTRDVLMDLLDDKGSRGILCDREVDLFVLFAGVNDSYGHYGPDFYAHHMTQITALIGSHGAQTLAVEIPDYGLSEVKIPGVALWAKRTASTLLFDGGRADNRAAYRARLQEAQRGSTSFELVLAAGVPSFASSPQLWHDPAHLNEEGYRILANQLATRIESLNSQATEDAVPAAAAEPQR